MRRWLLALVFSVGLMGCAPATGRYTIVGGGQAAAQGDLFTRGQFLRFDLEQIVENHKRFGFSAPVRQRMGIRWQFSSVGASGS